jgi:hypothetical protein
MDFYVELVKYIRTLDYDRDFVYTLYSSDMSISEMETLSMRHKLAFQAPDGKENFLSFMMLCVGYPVILKEFDIDGISVESVVENSYQEDEILYKKHKVLDRNSDGVCIDLKMRDFEKGLGIDPTMTLVWTPNDIADKLEKNVKEYAYTREI